jgi:BirA family biotin operon repressor/biotin-[acetyl-CoA-carboxylase] ligase
MNQDRLEQTLHGLALGPLRFFERIGSTNTEALRWAEAGAPDLSLVVADEQTAGRGRLGRQWFTPPGAALAFSLVLRGPYDASSNAQGDLPGRLARLTALGALAVSQALQAMYGLRAQIKWPNDVLLSGRKVCGILAEAQWQGRQLSAVILGIGINVSLASTPPEAQWLYPATSVEAELGRLVDRWQLLRSVLENLLVWRDRLGEAEFLRAWEDRLAFKGEWVYIYQDASDQTSPPEQGLLVGLDPAGCLQVRTQSGELRSLNYGELRLRPANPKR